MHCKQGTICVYEYPHEVGPLFSPFLQSHGKERHHHILKRVAPQCTGTCQWEKPQSTERRNHGAPAAKKGGKSAVGMTWSGTHWSYTGALECGSKGFVAAAAAAVEEREPVPEWFWSAEAAKEEDEFRTPEPEPRGGASPRQGPSPERCAATSAEKEKFWGETSISEGWELLGPLRRRESDAAFGGHRGSRLTAASETLWW
eukprot:RCo053343